MSNELNFARRGACDHEIRFRVDEQTYMALTKGANAEDRALADFVRRIIELHLYGLTAHHPAIHRPVRVPRR